MKGDKEWYQNMWLTRQNHQCEECGIRLPHFHPMFISHIITKGSYPTLRQHPENSDALLYGLSSALGVLREEGDDEDIRQGNGDS